MKIYTILEVFPSPYKYYMSTMFEDFVCRGHDLKIFAEGRHGSAFEERAKRLGIPRKTFKLPTTLKSLPRFVGQCLLSLLSRPAARLAAMARIFDRRVSLKRNLMNACRSLCLPLEPPDLCLVHNLVTMRKVVFLRALYPSATIGFYYHGGELPGVPEVSPSDPRGAFQAADIVITNTESSRDHAISRGCPPERLGVVALGFNLEEFGKVDGRAYLAGGRMKLVSIGRLSEEKGFLFALEAMAKLVREGCDDVDYFVVGRGPYEDKLREFVADNGLTARVTFLGQLPRDSLYDTLGRADALLLPSIALGTWQENQACVVQEAMLSGVLVATSITGGVPECIPPCMTQFSFPPGDIEGLVASIRALRSLSQERYVELGSEVRDYAAMHFDVVRQNDRLLAFCTRESGPTCAASARSAPDPWPPLPHPRHH